MQISILINQAELEAYQLFHSARVLRTTDDNVDLIKEAANYIIELAERIQRERGY